jgi:transposase InsO family protein
MRNETHDLSLYPHPTSPPPRSGGPAPAANNTAFNKMPKAPKETIPDGAIFQPQPKSAAGRAATKAELKMIKDSYYERGSVGRDSMFDWLKTKYPDTHPPRRTIQRFLNRQMLQQRLSIPRKSTTGQPFRPISPFHSFSIDLLDLTNKPAKNFRYIINLIDNFTRFQWLVPITGKEAWKVAKAMKKLLDEIRAKYKKQPKFILQDLGNEFEGPYKQLLIDRGIGIKKTLPASPWQNAIAERNAGGRVKVWLWKKMRVKGGSWLDHLDEALEVANNTMNRMTGFTPKNALSLDKAGRETLRERVLRSQEEGGRPPRPDYPLNLAVRVKLAKGLLSKQTDWSWSKKIYKITGVFPGKSPMEATRYSINKPGSKN